MAHQIRDDDPRDAGFHMPGEWVRHSCTWMAWPSRVGFWPDEEATARAYADVANTIARFEPVRMLVPAQRMESARRLLGPGVAIVEMSIDDSWTRDSGPNFLLSDDGELAGSTWRFNSWGGKYRPFDQDALMATRILQVAGVPEFPSPMVAEGGAVTVDGEGTILTTESCLLNANRNPDWTKLQVERELCRTLGADKVIWLPGDPMDRETDGHVDGIAAFVEPGRVLLEVNPDSSDPHHFVGEMNLAALKNQRDAKGRVLQIELIHEGIYHPGVWNGGCSSYVNSYLANGAVIVPGYGYDRDGAAIETYTMLYPQRQVVQVPINPIAIGGGGVHCITQQQPAVGPA